MRISDWSSDVCSSDLFSPSRISRPRHRLTATPPSADLPTPSKVSGSAGLPLTCSDTVCPGACLIAARIALARGLWSLSGKRSEEHTSELQSLMRISYAVCCLKKKNAHKDVRYT